MLERILSLFRRKPALSSAGLVEPIGLPRAKERAGAYVAARALADAGPEPLFLTDEFEFDDALRTQIRDELPVRTGKSPTPAQWEMILSTGHNTVVNAGAGSGKSTSLIQRVLVLHRYLGVPLEEMTVFSFTKKSTEEFREKLVDQMHKLGGTLTPDQAKKVVRTFHSKVLEFRPVGGNGLFDFLGSDRDAAELLGPMELGQQKLADPQREYLQRAYEHCYRHSKVFSETVDRLYLRQLRINRLAPQGKKYQKALLARAAIEDQRLSQSLQSIFTGARSQHPIPISLREFQPPLRFFANDYVPELGAHVVFLPDLASLGARKQETVGQLALPQWLKLKERALAQYSKENLLFVRTQEEFDQVLLEAQFCTRADPSSPPPAAFKLRGERDAKPLAVALYEAGCFVESMGVPMAQMSVAADQLDGADAQFVGLLAPFMAELDRLLNDDDLVRFASLFRRFSSGNAAALASVPAATLASMTHVFIDEFQDISPDVVGWIRGVLGEQKRRGRQTSLLCVGDDYQSIYGWRGSSPHYFLRYEQEFPSVRLTRVTLEENFRSGQNIIDSAERLLAGISADAKTQKHGRSALAEPGKVETRQGVVAKDIVDEVRRLVSTFPPGVPPSVFVLGRTNRAIDEVANELLKQRVSGKPMTMTFHGSKGLEADVCVLVGDCLYEGQSPFRDLAYRLAGFPKSYDEAQRDEALRLAYVAMTRARRHCVWFAVPKKGGAFELLQPRPRAAMGPRKDMQ